MTIEVKHHQPTLICDPLAILPGRLYTDSTGDIFLGVSPREVFAGDPPKYTFRDRLVYIAREEADVVPNPLVHPPIHPPVHEMPAGTTITITQD